MVAAGAAGAVEVPLDEVQGNILRAYGDKYRAVRHLVLSVVDPAAARRALASMVDGNRTHGNRSTPDVTPADRAPREQKFSWCLNVGFTYPGLEAIGVPRDSLATFPPEFVAGMAGRASLLSDVGRSAPEHWIGGLGEPDRVHLIVTIHGWERPDLEEISGRVLELQGGKAFSPVSPEPPLDGYVMVNADTGRRYVHFGYADGISQPRFSGIHDPKDYPNRLPFAPVGVVLLGYPSAIPHVQWKVPYPKELGTNGAFNAFRVLGQDVPAFEDFLSQVETTYGAQGIDRELTAAKLCGRWRNGAPLTLALTRSEADDFLDGSLLNDFDYVGGGSSSGSGRKVDGDPDGFICPIGSHIRRTNPRGAHIVQRSANRTRSLIRRGIPYGPEWDPDHPETRYTPRGLLGNFICASLSAQFEAMQYDWINLGLQDPRITGTNDPLLGTNDAATSSFTWPRDGADPLVLRGFGSFVFTRGGAYTFLPSIPAIRWISALGS